MDTATAIRTGEVYPHRILVTLDSNARHRLGVASTATHLPMTHLVREAISEWLDPHHPTVTAEPEGDTQ